jgi:hypothetical protein
MPIPLKVNYLNHLLALILTVDSVPFIKKQLNGFPVLAKGIAQKKVVDLGSCPAGIVCRMVPHYESTQKVLFLHAIFHGLHRQ